MNTREPFCNMYSYINVDDKRGFKTIEAEHTGDYRSRKPMQLFNDTDVLSQLNLKTLVLLSNENVSLYIFWKGYHKGKYFS